MTLINRSAEYERGYEAGREAERGRTRVLEEALLTRDEMLMLQRRLKGYTRMGDRFLVASVQTKLRASLAAVAVEDGQKDDAYETRSARPVPAGEDTDAEVVHLGEFRLRGLSERQREALERILSGEAECGLCGDLGAHVDPSVPGPNAGKPVPCMACGRESSEWVPRTQRVEGLRPEDIEEARARAKRAFKARQRNVRAGTSSKNENDPDV